MGRKPTAIRWNGHKYPTIGWAIGDALLIYPTLNDQDLAALLDVTVASVQYWRTKTGIPPANERRGSYYKKGVRHGRQVKGEVFVAGKDRAS